MLWPTLNPDGQTKVAEWYLSNVGTPYETSSMPELYQKYVGHDNNRDAYMLNMVESRVIGRTWREWEPQIVFVHHQSAPFPTRIWLPPFDEPVGNRVHPLMARTVNTLGMLMAQALEERGQVGATHMGVFDAWYPGYIDYLPMLQNAAAFWTETAGRLTPRPASTPRPTSWPAAGTCGPSPSTPAPGPVDGGDCGTPWSTWRRPPSPSWTSRRSSKPTCSTTATRRAGTPSSGTPRSPPYAYFIPQDQRDPVAPVELLRRLAFNGVRVSQLERPVTHQGITHPAGTWVIPMDQEFAELVRTLFEVQEYPDLREYQGGPPKRPYDVSGWTLPYQFGVRGLRGLRTPPAGSPGGHGAGPRGGPGLGRTRTRWRRTPTRPPSTAPPGLGFNSDTVAAGIVPLPGRSGAGARPSP